MGLNRITFMHVKDSLTSAGEHLKFGVETIEAFSAVMQDFGKRVENNSLVLPVTEKRKRDEDFFFIGRPDLVEVQQPKVVRTKGSCSDSGSRQVSQKEKAIMLQSKPKGRCRKCRELCHHDSRNCGKQKEK